MEKNLKKEENDVIVKSTKAESDKIWEEIKNLNVKMFLLPDQPVSNFCKPKRIEPSRLYVETTVQALLPALETLLNNNFVVDRFENLITIQRKI